MSNYKFTDGFNFWSDDHHSNFNIIKSIYDGKDHLNFLEIGILEGYTSVYILDNILTGENCHMDLIDHKIYKNANQNLRYHQDRITLYCCDSYKALIKLSNVKITYDFIYVDGCHNACITITDILLSWILLKKGGILLIDDYEMIPRNPWDYQSKESKRLQWIHPRVAIDAFMNIYRGQYDLIIDNYQVGLKKILNYDEDMVKELYA